MFSKTKLKKLVLGAMLLALAFILPFVTGGIPQIGNMLCPMHIPVLLCGYFCGPWVGLAVGLLAPILRSLILGMPPFMPIGFSMAFELAAYGFAAGLFYKLLPKKVPFLYVSLIGAMLVGRAVWGTVRLALMGLGKAPFGFEAFLAGAFTNAIPGMILQILLIPTLVLLLRKYTASER